MTVDEHRRYQDDVGAYLLGALPDAEVKAFEAHLEECFACRAEIERLRVATDALPRSVQPFEPPPSLKASLMRTVLEEAGEQTPARRRSLAERLGLSGLGLLRPQLAVGLAVVLLALGFGIGALTTGTSSSGGQRVLSASVDHSRFPNATASVVIPKKGGATLRVSGLGSPGPGHIYEVWLKRGNQLEPASLFSVGSNGTGAAGISGSLDGVSAILVTRESGPTGATAPTAAPILSVKT